MPEIPFNEWRDVVIHNAGPPQPMRALKMKAPKAVKARTDLSDDFLNLLLSGVKEIFEQDAYLTGFPLVEKHLGAKESVSQLHVQLKVDEGIERDFIKWEEFTRLLPELGWGDGRMGRMPHDDCITSFSFVVRNNPVVLWLSNEDKHNFDNFGAGATMGRYSIANGVEIDARCLKDLDKGTITCNKKLDASRAKFYEEWVAPRLKELTGKDFKIKDKK